VDSQSKPDGENKDISVPESLRREFDKYHYSLCDDAKIFVEQKGSKWRIDDEGKTYLIREQNNQLSIYLKGSDSLSRGFFDHFSRRSVVVVSPHSDDSVIACGGLIYYLCNRKLWDERGRGVIDIPRVSVLVMTPSARGVGNTYFKDYCRHIGLKGSDFNELEKPAIRLNESRAEALLLDTNSHWLDLDVAGNEAKSKEKVVGILRDMLGQTTDDPIFLVPNFGDQHPTHKDVTKLVLEIIRKQGCVDDEPALTQLSKAEIWLYESPWAALDPAEINVIIPLDKHAMFAKCQAVSMHQSQVVRTEYSDIARTHSRYNAEVLREMIFGFGEVDHRWDYVEVFSARKWELTDYSD
jgi:LmbE family N-acetylglucosaminyl deacetylase